MGVALDCRAPGASSELDVAPILQDAVEECLGEILVVEHVAPSSQRLVGGEDGRPALDVPGSRADLRWNGPDLMFTFLPFRSRILAEMYSLYRPWRRLRPVPGPPGWAKFPPPAQPPSRPAGRPFLPAGLFSSTIVPFEPSEMPAPLHFHTVWKCCDGMHVGEPTDPP